MTLVAVVWGGKAGSRKQRQMGFCSKDPWTDKQGEGQGTQRPQHWLPLGKRAGIAPRALTFKKQI